MALDPSQALFTRDFFFEVMKDSQRLRAGYLAERERWLRGLALDGREEILFEFEMLMRGLERYFNVHNLPLDARQNLVGRDFRGELRAVRDAIARTVHLTQFLLDPPSDRNLVFRKYLESQIVDDRARGQLLEQQLTQETPQESLFLIRSGLTALRGVVDGLLRLPQVSDQLFNDLGQVLVREIALNKYFRPFRPLEFRSEYDRIKSVHILEVLGRLEPSGEPVRRAVSLAFLALFRLLHYLRYVSSGVGEAARRAYVVMSLIRSEATALAGYLDRELPEAYPDLAAPAKRIAVEVRKEVGKVLRKHLAAAAPGDSEPIAKAREALEGLFKQWIVSLAQCLDPSIAGKELFDDYVSRREQAKRLRADLFCFREVCRRAAKGAARGEGPELERSVQALQRFVSYFRDVSYQLLRYGDYEPFDGFISILRDLDPARLRQPRIRRQLGEDCQAFEEVVSRIFSAVNKREELARVPFEESEARAILSQLGIG
ncbi:MAG TPA: hypothetical protein VMB50_15140 [Myxococcales bacterium]|nr:hypothetical protein [Myxococcales bacterium]